MVFATSENAKYTNIFLVWDGIPVSLDTGKEGEELDGLVGVELRSDHPFSPLEEAMVRVSGRRAMSTDIVGGSADPLVELADGLTSPSIVVEEAAGVGCVDVALIESWFSVVATAGCARAASAVDPSTGAPSSPGATEGWRECAAEGTICCWSGSYLRKGRALSSARWCCTILIRADNFPPGLVS